MDIDLTALGRSPSTLPAYLTSFIGREAEVERVGDLVLGHRLVTLTGTGGCGKTRLAHALATHLESRYRDGVWWIELSSVTESGLVVGEVARTMGIKEGFQPLGITLTAWLENKKALLILDNCEHLIEECAHFSMETLRNCKDIRIIATSRESLGVAGEVTWLVPPLSTRDDSDQEIEDEALRLFLDRASLARPEVAIEGSALADASDICSRLDGSPLAIELAAASMRLLSPREILEGIDDRFRLLAGSPRTSSDRHRSLRASVEWSFQLLNERETMLIARLAVFVGTFSLADAEEVCTFEPLGREEVLPLLTRLVEKSLVQVKGEPGVSRYRLLETIRQYAEEVLVATPDDLLVRDRHLEVFERLAEEIRTGMEGPEHPLWLERADHELENIRSAADWAARTNRAETTLRIMSRMVWYWVVKGQFQEPAGKIDASLPSCTDPAVRAEALATLATLRWLSGDLSAISTGEASVQVARSVQNPEVLAFSLIQLGWTLPFIDPRRGKDVFAEAVPLWREADNALGLAEALCGLGVCHWMAGELPPALEHMKESLDISRKAGLGQPRLRPLVYIPMALLTSGSRLDQTVPLLEEAEEVALSLGDDFWRSNALACHCLVDGVGGRLEIALDRGQRALRLALRSGNPFAVAVAGAMLGTVEVWSGRSDVDERLDESFAFFDLIGFTWGKGWTLMRKGEYAWSAGDLPAAEQLLERALHAFREGGLNLMATWAQNLLGLVLRDQDRSAEAADTLYGSLQDSVKALSMYSVPDTLDGLGMLAADTGKPTEALRMVVASEAERERSDYRRTPQLAGRVSASIDQIRDQLGDVEFEAARAEAADLSMDDVVAYVTRGRGSRKRPTSGWSSLTPTEINVVSSLSEGLTNNQIAERMFVSAGTIKTHLSHVYAKLGMSSRAEVAAAFAKRQE